MLWPVLVVSSFSLRWHHSGAYGLKLSGNGPPVVVQVVNGSEASRAGLQVGDFVLKVDRKDTRDVNAEKVQQMFRECMSSAMEVCVARPFPIPVTDKEKMRALIVLQTKVR